MDDIKKTHLCPICGGQSSYLFNSKHNKSIFNCHNNDCGHFFTPPLNKNQGICLRSSDIESESNSAFNKFHERNIRLLNLFMGKIMKQSTLIHLLDFGAGNAHISRSFKSHLGNKVVIYCYEPNTLCKDLYQKHQLIHITNLMDITKKIDLIYMIEVIEHLEDPISILKSLTKTLNPSGKIFISTPVGAKSEKVTNAFDTESHLHFFTENSLNYALDKSGLKSITYKYFPEMYPINSSYLKKIKICIVNLHSKILVKLKIKNKINHLVGFTEVSI